MDGINNDVGLDDVNAGDGENKFDLGYVHGGGSDGNDGGVVHDIGGVDFNGGDDVCCGDVETKVDYGTVTFGKSQVLYLRFSKTGTSSCFSFVY